MRGHKVHVRGTRTFVVAVVTSLLVVGALLLQGCGQDDGSSGTVTLTPKEMEQLNKDKGTDTTEKKDEGEKKDATTSTSNLPDLSSIEDKAAISKFLSNFSKIGLGWDASLSGPFSRSEASAQQMASLSVTWYLLNGGSAQDVRSSVSLGKTDNYGDKCVPASELNKVLEQLLGISYDSWEDLEKEKSPYRFDGSNVCWRGSKHPLRYGPAIANSTSESDDGLLHVNFYAYNVLDKDTHFSQIEDSLDIYNLRVLNSLMHVDKPNERGTAVLDCESTDDGWAFHLVSYEVSIN